MSDIDFVELKEPLLLPKGSKVSLSAFNQCQTGNSWTIKDRSDDLFITDPILPNKPTPLYKYGPDQPQIDQIDMIENFKGRYPAYIKCYLSMCHNNISELLKTKLTVDKENMDTIISAVNNMLNSIYYINKYGRVPH